MVRVTAIALFSLLLPAVALAIPPASTPDGTQRFQLPDPHADRFESGDRIGRTEIAPNTLFGFGMFGLKSEKSPQRAVTGRELDLPKQRRPAVGFSLRF